MIAPSVDVNLFAYNAAATIGPSIESVLAQSWPSVRLTVIDNGSTDATPEIAARYAGTVPSVRVYRARANGGAVVNCQRAFGFGDGEFVMPKTADDIIAPEFIAQVMEVMLAHPACAMCHAGGLVFRDGQVVHRYPPVHRLLAIGDDAPARARHVMAHYTSAPSFWGVYRRACVDLLAPFRYRAGWDHSVLAELALYGEIRHVPELLYWRRDGGKPVAVIARGCTEATQRGLSLDDQIAELRWRTPLITTAFAHLETFAVARISEAQRVALMQDAVTIFRSRWLAPMLAEAEAFAAAMPALLERARQAPPPIGAWLRRQVSDAAAAVATIMPETPVATLTAA